MTDYIHEPALVADPFTFARAANASIAVYDADDTFNAVPLVLKDLNGLPMANPVTSTGDAVTPWMITTSAQLKLVGGGLTVVVSSYKGLREDALRAQVEAQEAKTAARDAQAEAEAAKDAAVAAAGLVGAPADVAISTAINAPGSATREALHANYVPKVAGWDDAESNTVNSWHTQPRALHNELRQREYIGGVDDNGVVNITVFDLRRRTSHKVLLGKYEIDDHNCPAFLVEEDLPPVAAICRHAMESFVRVRDGAAPHDVDSLATAAEVQVPFPGACTYIHLLRKPGTTTIALLTRNSDGWYVAVRTAGVWAAAVRLFGMDYATFKLVGNTAQYAIYNHPVTVPNAAIRHFRIDTTSGSITNAAGTVIGNLWAPSLLNSAQMTYVRQSYDADIGHNSNRVLDIGPTGSVLAMQIDKAAPELGGMYGIYRKATTGATPSPAQSPDDPQRGWIFEPIVHSGQPVGYFPSGYPGGAYFEISDDVVFLDRESSGTWFRERWEKLAGIWTRTHIVDQGPVKMGRPQIPWGSEGSGILAGVKYYRYPTDNFVGYYGDQHIYKTSLATAVIPDLTPPAVPSGLTSTPGQLSAVLDWAEVVGAVGYRVYQGGSLKATVQASTYTVPGLLEGTPYAFHVSAFDDAGNESAKAPFPAVTPTARILTEDELLPDGTLVLIDPTHSLGAWGAGVPTTTVPNIARDKALATVGSGVAADFDFTVANTLTATDGVLSRTSKGALSAIISQATAVQNRKFTLSNESIRAFMAANPTHDFFLSLWTTVTRLSLETPPGTMQRFVGYLTAASGDVSMARLVTNNKLSITPTSNRIGIKESATPVPLDTPVNVNGAHSAVTSPGTSPVFVVMGTENIGSAVNKAASWVLYHVRLEDLTVSGRSYAQAAELDQIEFEQAFKAGARYHGDTYAAVSTLP